MITMDNDKFCVANDTYEKCKDVVSKKCVD